MFLAHLLYWTMPAALLLWIVALWRSSSAGCGPQLGRDDAVRAAVAAVMVGIVAVALPPAMRMQFDDTSICGIAQNMHEHRVAMMSMSGVPGPDGSLQVLDWNLDKRPPLVPFLVSVLHDLSGYRVHHAFVVNLVLTWLLLVGVGGVVARLGSTRGAALAAMVGVWALPLLWHVGTGAGLEVAFAVLMLVVGWMAREAAREPSSARVAALVATLALFAWSRYEAVVLAAGIVAVLAWSVRGRLFARATWWAWGCCALVLVPLPMLLWHGQDAGFYLESGGEQRVAFAHLVEHLPKLLGGLLAPTWSNPLPGLLAWLALVGLLLRVCVGAGLRGRGLGWLWLPPLAHAILVSAWFYGDPAEPTALRLYLPIAVLLAAAAGLAVCPLRARLAGPVFVPLFASVGLGLGVLAVARLVKLGPDGVLPPTLAVRSLDALDAALAKVPFDPQRTVVVTTAAQYLLVRGIPAVPPRALAQRGVGSATQVLFVTTALDAQLAPWFGDPQPLVEGYRAELVAEVTGAQPVRVWRVAK